MEGVLVGSLIGEAISEGRVIVKKIRKRFVFKELPEDPTKETDWKRIRRSKEWDDFWDGDEYYFPSQEDVLSAVQNAILEEGNT